MLVDVWQQPAGTRSTHFSNGVGGSVSCEATVTGEAVGEAVGDVVGEAVVGEAVGELVGDDVVGELVGEAVGDEVVGALLSVQAQHKPQVSLVVWWNWDVYLYILQLSSFNDSRNSMPVQI